MTSQPEFSRGEVIAEKYEVVDRLGSSPLGVTYRVKQLQSGAYLQLTLLDPKVAVNRSAVVDAYQIAESLDHPHLCKVVDLGEHDNQWFYTYEDFEGSSLRELLVEYQVQNKRLAVKEAAQICMQILEALVAMHRAGQVFRALRPEYVLVHVRRTGPRQQTLVADTKLVGAGMWTLIGTQGLAEDEFSRGEAQYLAPELKGFDPVPTVKADIYSVGVMLYELLVGQPPVGTFQLPKARREDLPDHVNDVVELALAFAPEDRYPTPGDFIQDIQRTFQDATLDEDAPERPLVSPAAWGIALALVLIVGVLLINLRPDQRQQAEARDDLVRTEVYQAVQASRPSSDVFKVMYARHPRNMVFIPEGPYLAGRLNVETGGAYISEPLTETRQTPGYLIDMFEHPNLQGATPTLAVTWHEANALCEDGGKRLCTSDEWERACKGPRSWVYSYGDYYDPALCGEGVEDVHAAGERKDCDSDYGVFDQSGGLREWTATSHKKDGRVLVKGGLKSQAERGTRCASTTDESGQLAEDSIGFRCCRDPQAAPVEPVAQED